MTLTIEFFSLLLLLLPGFVSSQVFYSTYGIEEKKISERIIDALIFSFVIYLITGIFIQCEPLFQIKQIDGATQLILTKNKWLICVNLLLMFFVPLFLTAIYHNDIFMKVIRYLKITSKSSRPNTWVDVFISENRHIVAYLKDGRRVRGYPTRFSTDPEEGFVYLFNPAWINDNREKDDDPYYIETGSHGFLINRKEIDLIEFTLNTGEILTTKNGA